MAIEKLPIFCYYDKQRFTQFGAMDCANWYNITVESAKDVRGMYPAMGRKHVDFLGINRLQFDAEPRVIFKSINYLYVVIGTRVFQIDRFYNQKFIGNVALVGHIWWSVLEVGNLVYIGLTDEVDVHIITEDGTTVTMGTVTDSNAPTIPQYIATFGNRFVVSQKDTPDYYLTQINLGLVPLDLTKVFTIPDGGAGFALFNRATGVIRQMAVLHGQLYIFTDFIADIWSNVATQITVAGVTREFPWKLNTSYNWDYGMADPFSLSVDFGRMTWLAKNSNGLVSFMTSFGQQPQDISSQAINVLLERSTSVDGLSPFLTNTSDGFLYQYENTVFYRVAAGKFLDFGVLDLEDSANAIEYNFETKTWHRLIELNGERNRIQKHVYFNNKHLVTVQGESTVYQMAGNIYYNELRTPETLPQAADAYTIYPMRYELTTKQLFLDGYAEFVDDYVQIDFVFGDQAFYKSGAPFSNTVYLVDEDSTPENPIFLVTEDGKFIIKEGTNYPTNADSHWNSLFKPHIELYISDDGGVTFLSADVRETWQLGQYQWMMRWNELGTSRNRCYKLVCVSPAPIVILGAVRSTRRVSGGAN